MFLSRSLAIGNWLLAYLIKILVILLEKVSTEAKLPTYKCLLFIAKHRMILKGA